jgi:hypothetical protein
VTLADSLKATVFAARGVAGQLGFRTHRAYLLLEYEGGTSEQTELVEGSGQPPRIKWEADEDENHDSNPEDLAMVGPITPAFTGGGTALSSFLDDPPPGVSRYILIVGPRHPDGAKYRIVAVNADKALRYMVRVQSESRALAGFYGAV